MLALLGVPEDLQYQLTMFLPVGFKDFFRPHTLIVDWSTPFKVCSSFEPLKSRSFPLTGYYQNSRNIPYLYSPADS